MSNNPLVTVITITYNLIKAGREKYVRQCIESVKNQTYQNIEHIIIDGASTDGTLEIFKDYPWLKVYSEPDKGIYDAMNKGVAHANGKYIAFLNSDDFWHDNRAVEASVKALEENNADFSYAPCVCLDESDNFYGYLYPTIETFFVWMPFSHQTMFTKTELVKFDATFKSAGDYDFVLNLILNGAKSVYVPLTFTSYRMIGISTTSTDLSYMERRNSIRRHLVSKYGISEKEADNLDHLKSIKISLLKKIINDVSPDLALKMKNNLTSQSGMKVALDIIPVPRKINVLFSMKNILDGNAKILLNQILNRNDCEIFLYKDSDVDIPEEFNTLRFYVGKSREIDAFCAPGIPPRLKFANIPLLTSLDELKYRYPQNGKNLFIKGSYKIRIGTFTIFEVNVDYGILTYFLFKKFPIIKIIEDYNRRKYYLFSFFKVLERRFK